MNERTRGTDPASSTLTMSPSDPRSKPVVLVPACNRPLGEHPFHVVGKKYVDAVRLAGCLPLVVPAADPSEIDALLDLADGVLLTGSPSNVHPTHFGEDVRDPSLPLDPVRDAWTLPLIPRVIARGMPLLGICRGTQEANVALGGSLHQAVHEIDGYDDHDVNDGRGAELQYAPAHDVALVEGGLMRRILGTASIRVNSVHGQGVNRLAPGLRVEATAPDGLVEAFTSEHARGFMLCVQWHPEWKAADNPDSMALLRAFGHACVQYRDRHRGPEPSR